MLVTLVVWLYSHTVHRLPTTLKLVVILCYVKNVLCEKRVQILTGVCSTLGVLHGRGPKLLLPIKVGVVLSNDYWQDKQWISDFYFSIMTNRPRQLTLPLKSNCVWAEWISTMFMKLTFTLKVMLMKKNALQFGTYTFINTQDLRAFCTWYWHEQRERKRMTVKATTEKDRSSKRQLKNIKIIILRTFCLQFWLPVRVKLLKGWHWFTFRVFETALKMERDMLVLLPAFHELTIHSSTYDHISHFTKAPFSAKSSEMIGTMYVRITLKWNPKECSR